MSRLHELGVSQTDLSQFATEASGYASLGLNLDYLFTYWENEFFRNNGVNNYMNQSQINSSAFRNFNDVRKCFMFNQSYSHIISYGYKP
jgi:hypothetical protein